MMLMTMISSEKADMLFAFVKGTGLEEATLMLGIGPGLKTLTSR